MPVATATGTSVTRRFQCVLVSCREQFSNPPHPHMQGAPDSVVVVALGELLCTCMSEHPVVAETALRVLDECVRESGERQGCELAAIFCVCVSLGYILRMCLAYASIESFY